MDSRVVAGGKLLKLDETRNIYLLLVVPKVGTKVVTEWQWLSRHGRNLRGSFHP